MAALGTGAWTADASNPGTATITATADPATTITAFSAAGTYNFIWTSGTCSDTASVSVTAKPDAGPDQTVSCIVAPGGTATMAATGAGTWTADPANAGTATITTSNDPATTITSFSTAGSYNFIWTNNDGCPDTAVVTVTAKPNAGSDATVCQNGTALLEATGTGVWSALPGNPSSATIDFPANSSVNVTGLTVAGTYGFVWPINGCADTANVLVNAPPVLAPTTTNITCNNATGAIFANAAGSGLTYLWSTGSTTDSINTTTAGVSYTVTVTDINQCTASASGTVNNNIVTVGITDVPTNVSCFGYNDGSIILTVTPAGTYTYSWDNTTGRDTVTGLAPGSYSVTATDANGCSSTLGPIVITEPTVDLVSITPLDTTIFLGDSIQLGSAVTGSYPVLTYAWTPTAGLSCTNCPNPLLVPTDFDTVKRQYQLTITYNNGCIATATDSILARPNDLSAVPNAFSPNGDDKNAVFKILATGVQSFRMNIYNRWGEQVFSSTDINQGWDGTYKGNQQPSEVYSFFYTITYHDGKVETKEGNVTLFR
jgi:gliding motility-associated-like protein